jgi:hypothetical protein
MLWGKFSFTFQTTVNLEDTQSLQGTVTKKNNRGEQVQRGRNECHRTPMGSLHRMWNKTPKIPAQTSAVMYVFRKSEFVTISHLQGLKNTSA